MTLSNADQLNNTHIKHTALVAQLHSTTSRFQGRAPLVLGRLELRKPSNVGAVVRDALTLGGEDPPTSCAHDKSTSAFSFRCPHSMGRMWMDGYHRSNLRPGNHSGTCTLRVVSLGNPFASRKSIIRRPILEENVPMKTSASLST